MSERICSCEPARYRLGIVAYVGDNPGGNVWCVRCGAMSGPMTAEVAREKYSGVEWVKAEGRDFPHGGDYFETQEEGDD